MLKIHYFSTMKFIYNIFIYLFSFGIWVASAFSPKAKKAWKGRENWEEKIGKKIKENENWIWMHCSSLGEFEQGRPVFEALKQKYPNYKFALSFFSPSGYEIRKDYKQADLVFYLPFDTPKNAQKLAKIFQPKLWILVKYDYWYNHLFELNNIGTPIIVISAIFRKEQSYFKNKGKWLAKNLKTFINHFFVQDSNSKKLLTGLGIEAITVAGDTRFDRVKNIAKNIVKVEEIDEFKSNNKLMVVGSSWKDDEDIWVNFINNKLYDEWKVVIVPHEIDNDKIVALKDSISKKTILFSEIEIDEACDYDVLIVDSIGLLSRIYASADLAYVGGGFNKSGVHNTLEPAVFGVPVVIGTNYSKFNEVKMLVENEIVFPISDYKTFSDVIYNLTHDKEKIESIRNKAVEVFDNQPKSTEIIIDYVTNVYL